MKKADIQAHYEADIKGASDNQLFDILTERIDAPKRVKDALVPMARAELVARGFAFPDFTAMFRVAN
jgi:hypothetical protein